MRPSQPGASASIEEIDVDELTALCAALDAAVRGGAATLEDFGRLAQARQELARRQAQAEPVDRGA